MPGNDAAAVARVLADAGIPAEVGSVPASFEETFVVLTGEPRAD